MELCDFDRVNEESMTLAQDWRGENVAGWLASEKMNGCRAYWDGSKFWTRAGNVINAPAWFTRGLPSVALDGEIWAGRGEGLASFNTGFHAASNAVRLGGKWFESPGIEFVTFDLPELAAGWAKRMREAAKAIKGAAHARAVKFFKIDDYSQITNFMRKLRLQNGEGCVFRNPVGSYEAGRTGNLLRCKFVDQ
jgi:DNA ligase 1